MLTQLGRKKQPEDIVDLLVECHERIRRFIGYAERLGAADGIPDEDAAELAAAVHRYFTEAFPLHVDDEERSVLPRLQGREPDVDRALSTMRQEHARHDALVAELVALCAALMRDPTQHGDLRPRLAAVSADLATELESHLQQEETIVFVAIRKLLSSAERRQVVDELRARRRAAPRAPADNGL